MLTTTDALHTGYEALTKRCGLVDRSERGKLALTGAGAVEFLNGQVTNELADLHAGEGRYAAFLTNKGKMLGDLRILAVGEVDAEAADTAANGPAGGPLTEGHPSALLLDTERVALQALFDMIRRYKIGYEVELHKRTLECALLSLIGPAARACAARAAAPVDVERARPTPALAGDAPDRDALPQAEHAHISASFDGVPVRLIATAEGVDVLCAACDLETVRAALLRAGATAVEEAVAEVVRVERGRPRYGIDIDESTIPQEAGLNERGVSFTKGCYVGQETVARLYWKGKPNRHLRGLRFSVPAGRSTSPEDSSATPNDQSSAPDGPSAATCQIASGEELRLGERVVGRAGSVVDSPRLGTIGLALVRREAAPGDTIAVGAHGAVAELVELPFPAQETFE